MASIEINRQTHLEYQEVFSFFCAEARTEGAAARVTTEEFTTIVRSLGYAPTKQELEAYVKVVSETYEGRLTFDQFVVIMVTLVVPQQAAKPDPSPAVRQAFQLFGSVCRDGDVGSVAMKDLEYLMTQRGEALNEAEFRHMQRAAKPQYGRVQYERLLQALSSEAATAEQPASDGSPMPRAAQPGSAAGGGAAQALAF